MYINPLKIQFVRQLLGAAGGALIAIAVYGAYQHLSDAIVASLPQQDVEDATVTSRQQKRMAQIATHARALLSK